MRNVIMFLIAATLAFGQGTVILGNRTIVGTVNFCSDAGVNDTYTCNITPAPSAYVTGALYNFRANTANTGTATINFNSLGAVTIRKNKDQTLADNDIKAGQLVTVMYDGTDMQMQSQTGTASGGGGGITAGAGMVWPYYGGTRAWQRPSGSTLNLTKAWKWVAPYSATLTKVTLSIQAGSGTSCTGGTCGLIFGLYSADGNTLLGTARAVSGGSPNINAAGIVRINFLSSVSITGGQDYILVLSTDSSVLEIHTWDVAIHAVVANSDTSRWGNCANNSTGNGNAIAFASTCGAITATSDMGPPILAFVH